MQSPEPARRPTKVSADQSSVHHQSVKSNVLGVPKKGGSPKLQKAKTLKHSSRAGSFEEPLVDDEVYHGRRKDTNYLVGPIDLEPELAREISQASIDIKVIKDGIVQMQRDLVEYKRQI